MKRTHQLFVPFEKVEKQADGTLKVYGIASSETEDSDGEVVTADAMRGALPDYMTFGAVREMHQPIAAGTAIEATVNDAGQTEFGAHIVDPVSVKKVETSVLKGFSIGGRITKRNGTRKNVIEGLSLTEISLVDRPANPDAKITLVKFGKDGRSSEKDGGTLKKGMYDVARLADLLCSLNYLTMSVQSEAVYEGDGSAMGTKLHGVCVSLVECLQDMVDEETAEMLGLTAGADIAAMAAKAAGLSGVGAVRDALAEIRKHATSHGGTMDELTKVQGELKAAREQLEKAQTDAKSAGELLEKAKGEVTDLTGKLAKSETDRQAAEGQRDELAKEAGALVESLTAKGHLRAVAKEGDVGGPSAAEIAAKKAKDEKDPIALTKQAFQSPRSMDPRAAVKA